MQNRSKLSLWNALSAVALTMINGLFGIVVTRLIIAQYGSDFNGLNSTVNQIVNVLLVLEGGFTMASNVALFDPLTKCDYNLVNGILTATRSKFRRIGLLFLAIGLAVSVGYGFVVNSALPTEFVITVVVMTVIPAAFNLFYATTYRVLLQAQQKEYAISLITTITIALGHVSNIVLVAVEGPMWMVRFNTMVFNLLNSVLIVCYVKRKAPFLNFAVIPHPERISGTNDVMVQKITGVIYNSAPIVFLSVSPVGGTLLASVYAVYNNVFSMLKSLLHALIDAPRLSFGQLLTERKREDIWLVFAQYEYAAFSAVYVLLCTCGALIMPFINLYMDGITDVNYYDLAIAVFMLLIAAVEMIHIPSGHLINMAGEFRISRNFQLISCIVLLIGMVVGGSIWGIYGMLGAVLLVAFILACLEIGYVHTRFFQGRLGKLARLLFPMSLSSLAICYLEMHIPLRVDSYLSFLVYGIVFTLVNTFFVFSVGFIFNRKELTSLVRRFCRLLKR